MGAYTPYTTDDKKNEWVPMSWCVDGRFNGDMFKGAPIDTPTDVPELAELFQKLNAK